MKNVIKNIAQEIAEEKGFLLINSVTKGSNKKPLFEVYIDNKEGITAKNCAEVSSEIKNRLELTEIGDLDYQLVVSSPGIDESIKYIDQYFKHINREFRLSFDDGEKIQSIESKLIKISDEILTFEYKNEELDINFRNIKKAKVKISF
jgi:ribosome maturation factor RimP